MGILNVEKHRIVPIMLYISRKKYTKVNCNSIFNAAIIQQRNPSATVTLHY